MNKKITIVGDMGVGRIAAGLAMDSCFVDEGLKLVRTHPIEGSLFNDQTEKVKLFQQSICESYPVPTKAERNVTILPVRTEPKVSRNQPCPCGSRKKYKRCCMFKAIRK